jgi:hypothetical protein
MPGGTRNPEGIEEDEARFSQISWKRIPPMKHREVNGPVLAEGEAIP